MACIIKDNNGNPTGATANNGNRSILFDELLKKTPEMAEDAYAIAQSTEFKEETIKPQIASLKQKLNTQQGVFTTNEVRVHHKPRVNQATGQPLSGIEIDLIETPTELRGQGRARQALENFLKYTDTIGEEVHLFAAPRDRQTTEEGLISLYESLGFQSDQFLPQQMVRKPKSNNAILDKNGEPRAKDVYEYINRNNSEGIEITKEDRVEIIKTTIGMESTDQLLDTLTDAFYKDGLFSPTKASLKRNGYTEAEATGILTDLSLQSQIKTTIDKIKALPSPISLEDMEVPPRVFLSLVPNAIGKLQAENPYLLEQEIIDTLGGIKTKEEFDLAVEESGMEVAKDRFDELSQYTEIPVMEVTEEGELVNKPLNNTAEVLTETLTEAPNNNLRDKIDFVLTLPDEIALNEQQDVETLLEDIRAEAIEIGLDLENISTIFNEKPLAETKDFLQSIKVLLREGRTGIQPFSESYNNYFGIDTEALRTTKQLNVTPNTIKVENVSKTAYDMFTEHGLLYVGNGMYKKVNNRKTKEELYAAMSTRTELFPSNIFDGINMTNTAAVTEAIRRHTEKQIAKMETSENVDADTMEAFYLNSVFFGSPMNIEAQVKPVRQIQNAEYLTDEFIADFNKKKLQEKLKDSPIYNDFYKNTSINKNGIEFISVDPISMRLAQEYMDGMFKDYLSIKKDSNIEIPAEDLSLEDENFVNRNKYINFAQSLPKLTKPYSRVNENTIRIEDSNENFVRIKDGVYELIQQNGTDSYYYKLPNNTSNYIMVFEDLQVPTEIETPKRDTTPMEPEVKVTNLFTKQEESKIDEQLECA
jgi:predicted GNAT family acetyltransferase